MFKRHLNYFLKFGSSRQKEFVKSYFGWPYPHVNPVTAEDVLRFHGYTVESFIQKLIDDKEIYKLYL